MSVGDINFIRPDGLCKIEYGGTCENMDSLPLEVCDLMVTFAPFEVLNGLARICHRLAKLVFGRRDEIVSKYVSRKKYQWYGSNGYQITGCRDYLPNGTLHGLTTMVWEHRDYSFYVYYARGKPTYWSILTDSSIDHIQCWGHVDTHVYLMMRGTGFRFMALIIETSDESHYMSCDPTLGAKAVMLKKRGNIKIVDRAPPSPYFVDGNIAVESIIPWARKYMHDHNIVAVAPDLLDPNGELYDMIDHFPGFDFDECFGLTDADDFCVSDDLPKLIFCLDTQTMASIDLLPLEICDTIITLAPFEALNRLARTCRRLAKLIFDRRIELANMHSIYKGVEWVRYPDVDGYRDFLPNGVNHGLTVMYWWNYDYEFRVHYMLGTPTHWSVINNGTSAQYWGHVNTRAYIMKMGDDLQCMALLIKTAGGNHGIICGRDLSDREYRRFGYGVIIIKDRLPPNPYLIDGNMAVESIVEWTCKYMDDHNITAIAPDLLNPGNELPVMIEHFPGVDFGKCFGLTL